MNQNDSFGIPSTVSFGAGAPPVSIGGGSSNVPASAPVETPEARINRLRAKAEGQAAAEFNEDAVYAQLLSEARAKQVARLAGDKGVEFPVDTQGFPEDYDKIIIFRGRDAQDLTYVPLGINGFVIKAPRDEEIIIPSCFTKVLDQAVENITIKSQGGIISRPAHRFPYNRLGKATKAEYQAFQVAQRAKAQRETAQAA